MSNNVTKEVWDEVFQPNENNQQKKIPDSEYMSQVAVASLALIDIMYKKYDEIKYSEHIPINGRVKRIVEIVNSLKSLHLKLDRMFTDMLQRIEHTENILTQCELLNMGRNLFLVDALIFSNKKTKEAHKDFYNVVRSLTPIKHTNGMRSMLHVGTLSGVVKAHLHGTPLASNLSFMRTMRPGASDNWNIGKINARLVKMNEKLDQATPQTISTNEPLLTKCGECGHYFDTLVEGFRSKQSAFCGQCWLDIISSQPRIV